MARIFCLLSLVVLVASFPLISKFVSGVKGQDREEIEAIIEEYIYKNPNKVISALSKGQAAMNEAEMRKRVAENRVALDDVSYPSFGNRESKVLLVEFFDFSCGYCKSMLSHIKQLLDDGKARIVFRDLPALGEASTLAARAALAVHFINPEKYVDFYYAALDHNKRFTDDGVVEIAESIGIKEEDLKKSLEQNDSKINAMINATRDLAERLNIGGTPSVVVGDTVLVGVSDLQALRDLIQGATQNGKGSSR
ncbi:putative disulfide oxidoreductase DsbA [Anaplasma centrale str. Israel]|uniref:Putative disulfide oxidoreductase DsbA n=1 Tax=Anaplasma centrale (strain Israel) TaxID=574556 RepID=D1ASZ7_ANACI|nr:DsbA family protein [Anaplasma centrale]ACZ49600.1 putative disulfide oxidoreductase DsbA [Anaplasma centrale str. Israel]